MQRKDIKIKYTIAALVVFIAAVFFSLLGVGAGTVRAYASSREYSNVLDDLQKDGSFKASDYPIKPFSYGMEVIQIAESAAGELYIYVYHHVGETKTLTATSIKLSTTVGVNVYYELYGLTFCNSFGTLFKYVVNDLTVKRDAVRYYDISSIQRKYFNNIDSTPDGENTATEKAYPVGQKWTVCTLNGSVTYDMQPVEVVEVDKQTVGSRRYVNGINPLILSGSACDAHFLAFSTKRSIDRLISADLLFNTQPFEQANGVKTFGSKTRHSVTLYSDEQAENPAGGWLGKKAKWDRIASTEDFLNSGLTFKDKEIELFNKYDWVLNFYETTYDIEKNYQWGDNFSFIFTGDPTYIYDVSGTKVSDVTLMRLEFESEGRVLNLGVVSDIQSGSGKPTNGKEPFRLSDIPWWVWVIVAVVLLIVVAIVLNILSFSFPIVKVILKAIWAVISAPFRWIGNAVKRGRERREQRRKEKEVAEQKKAKADLKKHKTTKKKTTKKAGKK